MYRETQVTATLFNPNQALVPHPLDLHRLPNKSDYHLPSLAFRRTANPNPACRQAGAHRKWSTVVLHATGFAQVMIKRYFYISKSDFYDKSTVIVIDARRQ
jgi:hypothetical protein